MFDNKSCDICGLKHPTRYHGSLEVHDDPILRGVNTRKVLLVCQNSGFKYKSQDSKKFSAAVHQAFLYHCEQDDNCIDGETLQANLIDLGFNQGEERDSKNVDAATEEPESANDPFIALYSVELGHFKYYVVSCLVLKITYLQK